MVLTSSLLRSIKHFTPCTRLICSYTNNRMLNLSTRHSPVILVTRTRSCNVLVKEQLSLVIPVRTLHSDESGPIGKKNKESALPFMIGSFVFCAAMVGLSFWFSEYKKKEIERERQENLEKQKSQRSTRGKALIGGPFTLLNTEGDTVTDKTFLGKWLLIYFGFTFCPDICPEELEKIGEIVDLLDKTPSAPTIQPIFISVDPKRDTPELIKSYLEDFHPRFIGLTGTKEQVKRTTKAYRVYYSAGPDQSEGANEYIVDHSIVTFLVNPKGDFTQNFGQRTSPEEAVGKIVEKMNEFYLGEENS